MIKSIDAPKTRLIQTIKESQQCSTHEAKIQANKYLAIIKSILNSGR